jgi:hypothetical protein
MEQGLEGKPLASGSGAIQRYAVLNGRILKCIDQMLTGGVHFRDLLEDMREKLVTNTFNLVAVGQFKRGKTLHINALLGADILPVAVVPLTSIVTILTFGEQISVRVFFNDGEITEIRLKDLADYVTEMGNPGNRRDVKEVVLTYPSPYLRDGVRLVDTPGVGSVYLHNTDVAYHYLPKSDAALFLLSVEQPMSQAELDFLKDVREYSDRIFFLLNKIDYLTQDELQQSVDFSRQVLAEAMGTDVKIFPISAKLALEAKLSGAEELLRESNLTVFSEALDSFLLEEKGLVLLSSVTHQLLRILSQTRLELELELKSLSMPLEELRERIAAFETRKKEIERGLEDFAALLDSDVNRLIGSVLDGDMEAFKKEFVPHLEQHLDTHYRDHSQLSLKELHDALAAFVENEVRQAFSEWRSREDKKLAVAFEAICHRFAVRIDETIEMLQGFSSELFAIPFEPVSLETVWKAESHFYYKLNEEPVGLDLLLSSVTQVWPKFIGDRFKKIKDYIFRQANRRIFIKVQGSMLQMIDMLAGRMRYDFRERINRSALEFRREMLQKLDATIVGLGSAIEKGMLQGSEGEQEARARQAMLIEEATRLEGIGGELVRIRASLQTDEDARRLTN